MSDEEKEALDKLSSKKNESTWNDTIRQIKREEINDVVVTRQKYIIAVLNLIKKQQKEIEELKEDSCCMTNCVRRDKEKLFLQDKIKAKTEEYKKQIGKMEKDDIGIGFTLGKEWSALKAKVEFGQSLLEKE